MLIFDILFKVSSPKSSTRTLEQWFENPDLIFCSSLQNLRLGGINLLKGVRASSDVSVELTIMIA
jgi:hypothetical protein